MALVDVGAVAELWSGEKRVVVADGRRILLVNVDEAFRAYEDACQHLGLSFEDGRLEDGVLRCAYHAWEYDARDGTGRNPTGVCLRRFDVRVQAGRILVDLGDPERHE